MEKIRENLYIFILWILFIALIFVASTESSSIEEQLQIVLEAPLIYISAILSLLVVVTIPAVLVTAELTSNHYKNAQKLIDSTQRKDLFLSNENLKREKEMSELLRDRIELYKEKVKLYDERFALLIAEMDSIKEDNDQ